MGRWADGRWSGAVRAAGRWEVGRADARIDGNEGVREQMMIRATIAMGSALALVVAAFAVSGVARPALAAEPDAAQAGSLVTQEELCAFRAPLFIDGGDVPAGCAPTIEWLRRLAQVDRACADLWVEQGAIPACALEYR